MNFSKTHNLQILNTMEIRQIASQKQGRSQRVKEKTKSKRARYQFKNITRQLA